MGNTSYTRAIVAPTGFGSFCINWPENPEHINYSGPFETREEATDRAILIAASRGNEITPEQSEAPHA